MDLALNNLKRVDMPLNKETKPNQKPLTRSKMLNALFRILTRVTNSIFYDDNR